MLTAREKWLIEMAFDAGKCTVLDRLDEGVNISVWLMQSVDDWLADSAGDGGVTVEDVLCKQAPTQYAPTAGLSWNGNNVSGDVKSIAEVHRLVAFEAARKVPDSP